jgi:hypothetical protein
MKMYGGVTVQLHRSWPRYCLEVSADLHTPAALPPGESAAVTYRIGG